MLKSNWKSCYLDNIDFPKCVFILHFSTSFPHYIIFHSIHHSKASIPLSPFHSFCSPNFVHSNIYIHSFSIPLLNFLITFSYYNKMQQQQNVMRIFQPLTLNSLNLNFSPKKIKTQHINIFFKHSHLWDCNTVLIKKL